MLGSTDEVYCCLKCASDIRYDELKACYPAFKRDLFVLAFKLFLISVKHIRIYEVIQR